MQVNKDSMAKIEQHFSHIHSHIEPGAIAIESADYIITCNYILFNVQYTTRIIQSKEPC